VTYHSQTRWHARLAPDGKSALYSMRRDGRDQVVRSLLAQPSILPMNINGRLLDVSSRGELAVVVEAFDGGGGTLARVFEGAGPRALADRVTDAAWVDDESLAIIRDGVALEFPVGTSLRRNDTGKLDLLRASPSGDRFAFVDHPASADTRGRVIVVDRTGKELAASSEQTGIEGVAWSLDGNEVWFSNGATITALDRKGLQRVVLRGSVARLVLSDVNAGKILVAPSDVRLKMFTGKRGGPYREVGLFDSSEVTATSADGTTLAFVEAAGTGLTAEGYAYFLRRGDQPPALIAQAFQLALLPDASAAVAVTGPTKLSRIPTGVGAPSSLALGPIATLDIGDPIAVSWNGRHVVVRGAQTGSPMKLWRFDLAQPTAPPLAIDFVHEGGRHPISPDGSTIAVARAEGGVELVSIGGAPARPFEGASGEQPIGFTGDGTGLFVLHERDDTLEVDRIELASGARTSWVKILPEQRPIYYSVSLDPTGDLVTYSTNSDSSDLYVIEPPAAH
jgi:dipeptidyl aminopeptidase/acylaminoacyl peptidase